MRQVPLDIVAGSYADETRPFSSQDTVNYLPVFAEQGGTRTPTMLKTPPGLRPFVQVLDTSEDIAKPIGPVRRTHNCEGKLFAVMGQTLYQVTPSGVAIPQGTVPGISRCSMAHNQLATGNQLVTVNGTSGYVFNTQTQVFERITDEGFPGAIKVIFMDGYIVGIEPRRRFAFCSEVADALAYNTLDRFTSEYLPDLLVSLESVQNQLVLFSEGSMEFFENTGATEQPFRSKRISQKRGCAGTFTTAVIDQTVYWLGDDGIFYRLEGYAPRRISTRPIEQAIRGLDWRNAFAETWTDAGHLVVYWTFPDGMTWGYDISSGQWHRRQSYGFNRWRPNTLTYINSEWVAGDFQNGRLWKLDWDYVLEGDDEIISERVTQTLADNQNRMLVSRVELIVDTGQPMTSPQSFPEQPDSPEISGDAPDGSVGVPWGPYSYSATGGTPPYKFSLRSGELPPGFGPLGLNGELPAVTPDTSGEFSFSIRVTDSVGLWDELDDEIQISSVFLALPSETAPFDRNRHAIRRGIDAGTDWSPASIPTGASENFTRIATSGDDILLTSGSLNYALSTNRGQTFALGSRTGVIGHSDSGRSLKAGGYWFTSNGGGSDPISRYDGASFTQPFTGIEARIVDLTEVDGRLIGAGIIGNPNQVSLSDDYGETWTHVDSTPGSASNPRIYSANDLAVITYHASNQVLIKYSEDRGATWAQATSPFPVLVGDAGSCIHFAQSIGEDGIWVSADGKGNVAHSQDGKTGWTLATTPLSGGVFVTGVASTGGIIECSCSDGSFIRSTDGLTYSAVTPVGQPAVMHDIAILQ